MNYYYPYYSSIPLSFNPPQSTFSRIFGGINLSSILNGTQKTLNIVNQTIPLVKQAGPIIRNAKTMFKVMNEFKKIDAPIIKEKKEEIKDSIKLDQDKPIYDDGPTFFI